MAASDRQVGQAYRAGYAGRALPDSLDSDSFAVAAHAQGVDDRESGRPEDDRLGALAQDGTGGGAGDPEAPRIRSSSGGGRRSSSSGPASRPRRRSPPRPPRRAAKPGPGSPGLGGHLDTIARRTGISRLVSRGGDGGGLLLAVFAYPLVLAVIQHGPAGAGAWVKAKFLNKGKTDTTPGAPPFYRNEGGSQGSSGFPSNSTPPGTGRLPNGQKIPGTPPDLPPGSSQS